MLIFCDLFCFKFLEKIFVDARKCIDRLQHVNDEGVIPKKMLKSKSKIEVTLFVKNMIDNDEIYEQFDEPIDDDKDFVNLDTGLIIERMDQFMKDNLLSFTNTQLKPKLSMKMFPMNKRYILIKVILIVTCIFSTYFLVLFHNHV